MIRRKIFALGALLIGVQALSSVGQAQQAHFMRCDDGPHAEVNSKKKLLKEFTADFWQTVQFQAVNYPRDLQKKGIVVGDFHFGNVGIYFDRSAGKARLTLNDLDDAGSNLLIGDVLKYLVYLRTIDKKGLHLEPVIDAYLQGLKGQLAKAPAEVEDLLHMRAYDFDKKRAKYVQKREDDARNFDESKLSSEQKETFSALEKLPLFQQLTHIQKFTQTNESGSSAGMNRYLFLATSKAFGTEGLIEFKSLRCSATAPQTRQDLEAANKQVVDYLLALTGEEKDSSLIGRQQVLWVANQFFLYREKQPNLINKLGIEGLESDDLQKYAEFFASYLGFIHSQSADEAYRKSVSDNKAFILDQLKPLFSDFKKRLENEN